MKVRDILNADLASLPHHPGPGDESWALADEWFEADDGWYITWDNYRSGHGHTTAAAYISLDGRRAGIAAYPGDRASFRLENCPCSVKLGAPPVGTMLAVLRVIETLGAVLPVSR